jgi:hypothetical protein
VQLHDPMKGFRDAYIGGASPTSTTLSPKLSNDNNKKILSPVVTIHSSHLTMSKPSKIFSRKSSNSPSSPYLPPSSPLHLPPSKPSYCPCCEDRRNPSRVKRTPYDTLGALKNGAECGCRPCSGIWHGLQTYVNAVHPGYQIKYVSWKREIDEVGIPLPTLVDVVLIAIEGPGIQSDFSLDVALRLYTEKGW